MPKDSKKRDEPQQRQAASATKGGAKVQGEGDYEAARRHREAATGFVRSHDTEREAREAAPESPTEARELLDAEQQGRARGKGEDRRDVMQDAAIDSPADDKAT